MTNLQDEVPFLGDLPLLKNTYYSIELYAEEDVYWSEETQVWEWVYGRQSEYLVVDPQQDRGAVQSQPEMEL
jgi:hypothetical protein